MEGIILNNFCYTIFAKVINFKDSTLQWTAFQDEIYLKPLA